MGRTIGASSDRIEYTSAIAATTAMSWCGWVKGPSVGDTTSRMLACQEDQWRVNVNAEKYGGGTPTAGALMFGRSWGTTDQLTEVQSPGATWSAWNHVAVTYDGSATTNAAKFYLNGVLLTNSFTRNAAGSIDNSSGNPNVGNDNAHTHGSLGTHGPSSFHNVVLTQGEILEHMWRGFTPRGCYASWLLLGDSPEPDLSGNGRSGTVTGTTVAGGPPIYPSLLRLSAGESPVLAAADLSLTLPHVGEGVHGAAIEKAALIALAHQGEGVHGFAVAATNLILPHVGQGVHGLALADYGLALPHVGQGVHGAALDLGATITFPHVAAGVHGLAVAAPTDDRRDHGQFGAVASDQRGAAGSFAAGDSARSDTGAFTDPSTDARQNTGAFA